MAAPATGGFLAGFAARPDLSAGLIALMIVAAVGVGAIHALGPGHGKSLIGAYLIGADGTLQQAAVGGAAVSVMHTASVLALGLLVLSAERVLAPERVYPWLGLASGLARSASPPRCSSRGSMRCRRARTGTTIRTRSERSRDGG